MCLKILLRLQAFYNSQKGTFLYLEKFLYCIGLSLLAKILVSAYQATVSTVAHFLLYFPLLHGRTTNIKIAPCYILLVDDLDPTLPT